MKKVSALIISLVLIVALIAVPVLAAQTATATVTASATTAKAGDTITFRVKTTTLTGITSGGFLFDFDTDVFSYVSGKALNPIKYETDANGSYVLDDEDEKITSFFCGVNTANGVAGFFMSQNKDDNGNTRGYRVSGEIFEIKLKVKDGAPAGETTIGGTFTFDDGTGKVEGTTVAATVELPCDHDYTGAAWTKADDTNHQQVCNNCGKAPKTEAHKWDNGVETTPATCKAPGETTYTCTVCGATKTAPIAQKSHEFGAWTKVDDNNHKRTCTLCNTETETKAHNWDAGSVTTKPDCKNPGEKTYTCATCSGTKAEPVPPTGEHGYNTWTKVDDEKHSAVCSGCGEAPVTEAHKWDNGVETTPATCDTDGVKTFTCTANGCGATKTAPIPATGNHNFGSFVNNGEAGHTATCTTCTDGTPETKTEAHVMGEMQKNETTHWTECACGYKNEAEHVYDETKWMADAEGHYHGCVCGAEKADSKVAHTWDEGVVTKKPTNKKEGEKTFTCTTCEYKRAEKIDKTNTPSTGDNTLVIPMVILAVLSVCGLGVTAVARKRASR